MKRILSALLAVAMLFSLCTFNVFAGETKKLTFYGDLVGNGGTADPTNSVTKDQKFYLYVRWKDNGGLGKGWAQGSFDISFDNTKIKVTGAGLSNAECYSLITAVPNEDDEEVMDIVPFPSTSVQKPAKASDATAAGMYSLAFAQTHCVVQNETGNIIRLAITAVADFESTDITIAPIGLYSADADYKLVDMDESTYQGSTVTLGKKATHTHTMSHTVAKTPTKEDNNGNIEYWYCDGCKKYFSDEAGANEITTGVTYKYDFENYAEDLLAKAETTYTGGVLTVAIPGKDAIERDSTDELAVNYNWSAWLMENGRWIKMEKDAETDTFTAEYESEDNIYKTYVHCVDDDGVSLIEKYDSVVDNTAVSMGNAVITDIKVNGESVNGTAFVDLSEGSDIEFVVEGENLEEVWIKKEGLKALMNDEGNGVFSYTLSDEAGKYTYTFTAEAASGHDGAENTVKVQVFDPSAVETYARVDTISTSAKNGEVKVSIGNLSNADYVRYTVSTPYTATVVSKKRSKDTTATLSVDDYGYFYARAIAVSGAQSDFVRTRFYNSRPGGKWTMTATANNSANAEVVGAVDEAVTLNYSASFSGNLKGATVKYQVLKGDYAGYHALTDWTTNTTFNGFVPGAPGSYELIVLAKAGDGSSYEIMKKFVVNVPGTDFAGNLDVDVDGSTAGTPIIITASSDSKDVLYRYSVTTEFSGEDIKGYSPATSVTWVPTKPGTYTVKVEALGTNSFGTADAVVTKTVVVE